MSNLVTWTAVADSTALAALPVPSDIQAGTKVRNTGVGAYFSYTLSTASLVTNQVVAVAGVTGARWILDTSGGSVEGVTGASVDNTDPANPVVNAPTTAAMNAAIAAALPGAGTLVDSGAAALTNWTFASSLNGNTDGNYEIEAVIVIAAAGAAMTLAFNTNSAPTGTTSVNTRSTTSGASVGTGPVGAIGLGNDVIGGTGTLTVRIKLWSKASLVRAWFGQANYLDAGGASYTWSLTGQIAASNATNITDLRILSDTTSGIGAHSTVVWRKLNQTAQ